VMPRPDVDDLAVVCCHNSVPAGTILCHLILVVGRAWESNLLTVPGLHPSLEVSNQVEAIEN
jgi:hypothetical protein